MDAEVSVSAIAAAISLVASAVAIAQTRHGERLSRMPILVFLYDGKIERWFIRNVGYGPALNVVVAQQSEGGDEAWYNPVLVPAVSVGEQFALEWLGDTGNYSLGARYSDLMDKAQESCHFSYSRHDRCSVYAPGDLPPWVMPAYPVVQVRRHWERGLPWKRPGWDA